MEFKRWVYIAVPQVTILKRTHNILSQPQPPPTTTGTDPRHERHNLHSHSHRPDNTKNRVEQFLPTCTKGQISSAKEFESPHPSSGTAVARYSLQLDTATTMFGDR